MGVFGDEITKVTNNRQFCDFCDFFEKQKTISRVGEETKKGVIIRIVRSRE